MLNDDDRQPSKSRDLSVPGLVTSHVDREGHWHQGLASARLEAIQRVLQQQEQAGRKKEARERRSHGYDRSR